MRLRSFVPLLLLACSCRSGSPPLTAAAARDLPCDKDVTVERVGSAGEVYRASGCGMRGYYHQICFGTLGMDCEWRRVAQRAVDDLRCPPEQIEYEGLGRGVVRAWGCGGETFYRRQCEGDTCGWRLTTDPRTAKP